MPSLSILIPTYAFAPVELVGELAAMCSSSPLCDDYEIHVIDDGSGDNPSLQQARAINLMPHCHFTALPHHVGKSTLINQAAILAHFPLLLLIDSDARMKSPQLITCYLEAASTHPNTVICGSIFTDTQSETSINRLRYRYEKNADRIRSAEYRNRHPYRRFTTFNVMLPKSVLATIPFNERLKAYGYEDTLFGLQLQKHNIPVLHIDNPLIHTGIDENSIFLQKTETALQNLALLPPQAQDEISMLHTVQTLRRFHLCNLFRILHRQIAPFERRNLLGCHPNLFLFKLYKLGYYLSLPPMETSEK